MKFRSEAAMASVVVAFLQRNLWEVYTEVQLYAAGARADIVATRPTQNGKIVHVIECKLSHGLSVMDQAISGWHQIANLVSVATPNKITCGRSLRLVHDYFGIGHLCVSESSCDWRIQPKIHRKCVGHWDQVLTHNNQTAPAGNANSDYYSRFRDTTDQLKRLIRSRPGITMKEAAREIKHHYSSDGCAQASLLQWINRGVIKGIRTERNGRNLRLFYEETP